MEEKNTQEFSDLKKLLLRFKSAPAAYSLVATNIVVFIVLEAMGGTYNNDVMLKHGVINRQMILQFGEWYRLFTAMFLHFGIEHLLNNMLLLALMGEIFEKAVGTVRFIAIYISAGLTGAFLTFMNQCLTNQNDLIAGASGAIFGIVGGMIVVVLVHKGRYSGISLKRMLLMAILSLYVGFATAGTDNIGHLGGFFSGIVYTFMIYGLPKILRGLKDRIH